MKIDIGCGARRRPGFVGVDKFAGEGVDHVVDLDEEPLPFEDGSVDEVFSSHFLEHALKAGRALCEIVRVARPGAPVEIWVPHGRSNLGFLPGHVTFFTESYWEHACMRHPEIWFKEKGGALRLESLHFVLVPGLLEGLGREPLSFAIKHYFNVVLELRARMRVEKWSDAGGLERFKESVNYPPCTYGLDREDERPLDAAPGFWSVDHPLKGWT